VIFYGNGDDADIENLKTLLEGGERIGGLFCEFPSNPLLRVRYSVCVCVCVCVILLKDGRTTSAFSNIFTLAQFTLHPNSLV
jgi:hypothetical protein